MEAEETELDRYFIALVRAARFDEAMALIDVVSNINIRDRDTGATALILAAQHGSTEFLNRLEQREGLDHLAYDNEGNTAFLAAECFVGDLVLASRLLVKAQAQLGRLSSDEYPWPFEVPSIRTIRGPKWEP